MTQTNRPPTLHPPSKLGVNAAQANLTTAQLTALARKHNHDILNELYSFEVELTLLAHMIEEPETRASLARLRKTASRSANITRTFLSQLIAEDRSRIPDFEWAEEWQADANVSAKETLENSHSTFRPAPPRSESLQVC